MLFFYAERLKHNIPNNFYRNFWGTQIPAAGNIPKSICEKLTRPVTMRSYTDLVLLRSVPSVIVYSIYIYIFILTHFRFLNRPSNSRPIDKIPLTGFGAILRTF